MNRIFTKENLWDQDLWKTPTVESTGHSEMECLFRVVPKRPLQTCVCWPESGMRWALDGSHSKNNLLVTLRTAGIPSLKGSQTAYLTALL